MGKQNISVFSIASLALSIITFLLFCVLLNGAGREDNWIFITWEIASIVSLIFPIFAKYYRKIECKNGKKAEIIALIVCFLSFFYVIYIETSGNSLLAIVLYAIACILYAKLFNHLEFKPLYEKKMQSMKKAFLCIGATLAFWAAIFIGPTLIILWNNLCYYLTGGGYGENSIMYKVLSFVSQPLACGFAYAIAGNICREKCKMCVLVNCIVGACFCAVLAFIELSNLYLFCTLAISSVVCIICAVYAGKDLSAAKS